MTLTTDPIRLTDLDLTQRRSFGFRTVEHLRFADVDANGHVNNVAFLVFFENVRVNYIAQQMTSLADHGLGPLLAHMDIDYRAQMFHPGSVEAGARLIEIRRSSIVIAQAVFDQRGNCAATGHAVIVAFDRAAQRPRPLPEPVRTALEALMNAPGGSLP
jgi:acyl-CoA thioester hydrolase